MASFAAIPVLLLLGMCEGCSKGIVDTAAIMEEMGDIEFFLRQSDVDAEVATVSDYLSHPVVAHRHTNRRHCQQINATNNTAIAAACAASAASSAAHAAHRR